MMNTSTLDIGSLEEAYNRALSLEKSGKLDEAAVAYQEVLAMDPFDCGGAAMRLAAIERGPTPEKASNAYVATLFDQNAETFEAVLVGQLNYDVPNLVSNLLRKNTDKKYERMLDLGCGTGLGGDSLMDICDHITGVDISEKMVAKASEKETYDTLFVAEIENFLQQRGESPWDLIVANDVLPYFGTLEEFFQNVFNNLSCSGTFAFSSEKLDSIRYADIPYSVGRSHRFAHSESYVRHCLGKVGFEIAETANISVRNEEGHPVDGQIVISTKHSGRQV